MKRSTANSQAGVSLVEVIVGVAILAIVLVTASFSITQFVQARASLVHDTVALYLAEEGYELLRTVRDNDWDDIDTLTIGTVYYYDVTPTTIAITTTPNTIDATYTRSFVLEEVWRDNDDDIVPVGTSGAGVDSEIVSATVTVVGPSGTHTISGLISNLYVI